MDHSPPLQQSGIGVVVPFDFALDRELWRWMPDDISLHITRMPYAPLHATLEMAVHISDPALVAQGYDDVRAVSPMVMAYACTSGSFIGGLAGEAALVAAMTEAGAPAAVTTSGALLEALAPPRGAPDRHGDALRRRTDRRSDDFSRRSRRRRGRGGRARPDLRYLDGALRRHRRTRPGHRHRRRAGRLHQLHEPADLRRDRRAGSASWASRC